MKTSIPRVIVTLFALTFVAAACGSDTGAEWSFAPVAAERTDDAASSAQPAASEPTEAPAEEPEASAQPASEPTEAPEPSAEPTEPVASAEPAEAAQPSGEARVIALQADSALRFTDADGQPIPQIVVTPGETVRFEIDNTAGFGHNFWIGTDAELSTFGGTTDVGIPDWTTGVEVLEWVVPDDITNLKFACTVAGHFYTMQGTFVAEESASGPETPAEPAQSEAPAEPVASAEPATPSSGEPRIIEFEADAAIRFLQDGAQIRDIAVTPGETVTFRIENTAGFAHNFYIGSDDDLRLPNGKTDTGLPDWTTGFQELEWVVPEDISNLRFACTVPGHYYTMQGDFTVSP